MLNAANEVAVAAFLDRRLTFTGIMDTVAATVAALPDAARCQTLDDIAEVDRTARRLTAEVILRLSGSN